MKKIIFCKIFLAEDKRSKDYIWGVFYVIFQTKSTLWAQIQQYNAGSDQQCSVMVLYDVASYPFLNFHKLDREDNQFGSSP